MKIPDIDLSPLEQKLHDYLIEIKWWEDGVSTSELSQLIIQFLTEEYDRQIDEALGPTTGAAARTGGF